MTITYTLDRSTGRMYTRAEGMLTLPELEAHLDVEERDRALGYAELFDARGARTDLSPDGVRRLVERARQAHAAGQVVGPTAIVADNDVVFGMARMYAMLGEFAHAPVEVFREVEPALAWLDDFMRGTDLAGAVPTPAS
ncbi:MAG TPA: hypothetical protein VFJ82_09375 [Longimicrobium sp.]|nr:hypothetical protein [Longimicrobium sp.]